MTDFWLSCGHHLIDRDESGGLVVTDAFLKAYLARPEVTPPPDACPVERTLHAVLLSEPRRRIAADEIAAIADADARENWTVLLGFRDLLLRHPTLEAAYLAIARGAVPPVPHLFLNQLVHLILRNVLDGCDDAFVLRAAELFFRPQRMTLHEGALLAADEEVIGGGQPGPVSPLVSMLGLPALAEIDVLGDGNAGAYWARSDRFDFALDLSGNRRGPAALAEVIARFVRHLLHVEVAVRPMVEARDVRLAWYVGLDADGTRIGDALWRGEEPAEASRVVCLFEARFADPRHMLASVAGEPVHLILAMSEDRILRMKPQNLIVGLPVAATEPVS